MELRLARPAMALCAAADAFGERMQAPVASLRAALKHAAAVESASSSERTEALVHPLNAVLEEMDEAVEALNRSDVLFHHVSLLAATSDALAWVAAPTEPPAVVMSTQQDAARHIEKLCDMKHPSHSALADAARRFLEILLLHVRQNAPQPLKFADATPSATPKSVSRTTPQASAAVQKPTAAAKKPAAAAKKPAATAADPPKMTSSVSRATESRTTTTPSSSDSSSHSAPHLTRYREDVLAGPVASFEKASAAVGGNVATAAASFTGAMHAVYDFIVSASAMPSAPGDDEKQKMLAPIIQHMTSVNEVAGAFSPRDELFNHAKAIEDGVNLVSWIIAEKTPTTFVSDADASASFYLNKVIMASRKGDNAAVHKAFVDSLRAIFAATKAYIKEYHKTGLQYNIGLVALGDVESDTSPVCADDDEGEATGSYVSAFKELIDGPLAAFVQASNTLGSEVAEQAAAFAGAWEAEAELLKKAISMPKPDDIQGMLSPIAEKMGAVGAVTEKVDPRGPYAQHCNAVSESVGALGWVAVDEKATGYVGDMAGAGQFFVDKVKMGAKKTENPDAHRTWAKALETLFAGLKAYVKEYHTQKLVWNPPKVVRAAKTSRARDVDDGASGVTNDYLSAFKGLIDNQLAAFVDASKVIGGDVAAQAAAFAGAWDAEAAFLAKAIAMPKPKNIEDMLSPIAAKMGEVGSIAGKADPQGPLTQHLNAVGESVAALGWVAVDEKATGFVGDMAGAGQFFIDKVKMGARKTDSADNHRSWAKALETLFLDLKAYVKEFHTQKLTWNPPKAKVARKATTLSSDDDDTSGSDYVSSFRDLIDGPLAIFVQASNEIGGDVANQAVAFAAAWDAEAEFLGKAMQMSKPDDFQDLLSPIATKMGEVSAISERTDPRGPFAQHCTALSESVAALGWVAVEEKATGFVGDMAGAGQFFVDKVKMGAKKTEDPGLHRKWAKALENLFADLKKYVKEYHTQKLTWNPPKQAKKVSHSSAKSNADAGSLATGDSVSAFRDLIKGPLAVYVEASNKIGGEVAEQAAHFAAAWEAEAAFLAKAAGMPRPSDIQDMLAPIAAKMSEVGAVTEKVDPRGPFAQHCNAVGESVAALGWVAVDEKATSYVGEMAGAGQFFMDKVKMGARKADSPDAHKQWAKALEMLFADLKAYVKEYHTQRLTWNKL